MKLKTSGEVWTGRVIGWIIAAAISCGVIFVTTFMLGPALFSNDAATRRIAVAYYCPGAVDSTEERGPSVPTTSDPTGTYGHTVEVTCTFEDGSTKVISNEEYAVTAIGGMFAGGALCGIGIAIPIMLAPLFIFRKKKNDSPA